MNFLATFIFVFLIPSIHSSQILILSQQPYQSHQKIAANLAEDLALHGHQVTIFTSNHFGNYRSNSIQEFNFDTQTIPKVERNSHKNWLQIYQDLTSLHKELNTQHIQHPMIQKILNKELKFDVLIIDCVICSLLAVAELLDIPAIYLSPTEPLNFVNDHFGNEVNPALHPETHAMGYRHGKMSLPERFNSYISFHYWKFVGGIYHCWLMRQSLPFSYSCHDLMERMQFLFIYTHPAFGNVRPLVPKTIQFGFSYAELAAPVADDGLKKFLDKSTKGAVVFNVDQLHAEELKIFLNAFKEMELSVVLNIRNGTSFVDKNFYSIGSAQLEEVVGHPSVKLVISTADLRELEVLIKNHIPMLLVPLTHEQTVNARRMFERKVARTLEVLDMDEKKVTKILQEMLRNEDVYRDNLRKLETFASDRPKLKDLAAWYVEFIIRHKGAKHLDYDGRKVPYYQKMLWDIYAFCAICAWMLFKVVKMLLVIKRIIFERICKGKEVVENNDKIKKE